MSLIASRDPLICHDAPATYAVGAPWNSGATTSHRLERFEFGAARTESEHAP